ncbi:MAG: hypothetical protein KKB51_22685 [Candidatus Riflebacteria bacterium]|nr:hypothetical protein [Candidatus Riflebacteria bacterium]
MTNSFEFLPADDRRIRTPKISLAIFLLTASAFFVGTFALHSYSVGLEKAYHEASGRVEKETIGFISHAAQLLPNVAAINDLKEKTQYHNLEMGDKTSVWTKLFNALDAVMPEDSVILAIENPKTGKMSFAATDRQFKIRIALTSIDAANAIYMKLAAIPAIESLNFTPRVEKQHQPQQSLNVDLEFTFNETYATSP